MEVAGGATKTVAKVAISIDCEGAGKHNLNI